MDRASKVISRMVGGGGAIRDASGTLVANFVTNLRNYTSMS